MTILCDPRLLNGSVHNINYFTDCFAQINQISYMIFTLNISWINQILCGTYADVHSLMVTLNAGWGWGKATRLKLQCKGTICETISIQPLYGRIIPTVWMEGLSAYRLQQVYCVFCKCVCVYVYTLVCVHKCVYCRPCSDSPSTISLGDCQCAPLQLFHATLVTFVPPAL